MKVVVNNLLGSEVANIITNQISNKTLRGKLKGEINNVVQNWEYYTRCNAVYFLCKEPLKGNFEFFQKLFDENLNLYGTKEPQGSSLRFNEYTQAKMDLQDIKLFLSEGNVASFVVYNWL